MHENKFRGLICQYLIEKIEIIVFASIFSLFASSILISELILFFQK